MYIELQVKPTVKAVPTAMLVQSLNILGQSAESLRETVDAFIASNPLVDFVYHSPAADAFDYTQLALSSQTTLADHLLLQLHTTRLDPGLVKICEFIIASLDDSGYLRDNTQEMIRTLRTTLLRFQDALCIIQSLDPCGVGARSLSECLGLQLEARQEALQKPSSLHQLAIEIVSFHLEAFASGTLRLDGRTQEEISGAGALIRTLQPRPGLEYRCEAPIYIVPDILIKKDELGILRVSLINQPACPSLSPQYHQFLKAADPLQRKYIQDNLLYARSFISAMEERGKTLLRIAGQAVDCQKEYLHTRSATDLYPLSMSQLARDTGLNRSTVSRAVSGKYAEFQGKLLPLRALFTLGGSGEHSRDKILSYIQALCTSGGTALSDAKIASLLAQDGIHISRRTVNKYRNQFLGSSGEISAQTRK